MGGSKKKPPKQYQYIYYIDFAVLIAENPISKILKVFENGKLVYNNGNLGNRRWDSMTVYNGTQTSPSSIIQAKEGAANTPAFLGKSYVVFERYALKNSGNAIPNMEFIVEEKISTTLTQAIMQLMDKAKYPNTRYQTAPELSTIFVKGYFTSGPTSTTAALKDLMMVYDIVSYEYNNIIYFKKRSTIKEYEINSKFLSAKIGEDGDTTNEHLLTISNIDERKFPKEVAIKYSDLTKDLQWGSQSEIKQNNPKYITKILQEEVKLTLTPTEARNRVNTMLWQKWNERKSVMFKLAPSQFLIQETDVIQTEVNGQVYVIRVESVTLGANYITEVTGVVVGLSGGLNNAPYLNGNIETPSARFTPQEQYEIPELIVNLIDCGPLRDGDEDSSVLYFGQTLQTDGEFLGASIYKALSPESSYHFEYNSSVQSTAGYLVSTLNKFDGFGWDNNNKVIVVLLYGTLVSRTKQEVLQTLNYCAIGDEVLGFVSATLVAKNTYELQGLIRGRRGTSSEKHSTGERFISLYNSELELLPMSPSDHNNERSLKWVPAGEDIDNVSPLTSTYKSNTLREFRPVDFNGVKKGWAGDWVFVWKRRTRVLWSPLGTTLQPEPDGRDYWIRVYDRNDYTHQNPIRTTRVKEEETWTYTQEQQIQDNNGSPALVLEMEVSQINSTNGIEGQANWKRFYYTP